MNNYLTVKRMVDGVRDGMKSHIEEYAEKQTEVLLKLGFDRVPAEMVVWSGIENIAEVHVKSLHEEEKVINPV